MMAGYIYMIQMGGEGGPVKVGYTSNHPSARLRQLQTGNPFRLALLEWFDGTVEGEGLFHSAFTDSKLEGEWFQWSDALYRAFMHLADFGGGLPTIPPRTDAGCALLRHNHKSNGVRSRYPDGLRHKQIDWDQLAIEIEHELAECC